MTVHIFQPCNSAQVEIPTQAQASSSSIECQQDSSKTEMSREVFFSKLYVMNYSKFLYNNIFFPNSNFQVEIESNDVGSLIDFPLPSYMRYSEESKKVKVKFFQLINFI